MHLLFLLAGCAAIALLFYSLWNWVRRHAWSRARNDAAEDGCDLDDAGNGDAGGSE